MTFPEMDGLAHIRCTCVGPGYLGRHDVPEIALGGVCPRVEGLLGMLARLKQRWQPAQAPSSRRQIPCLTGALRGQTALVKDGAKHHVEFAPKLHSGPWIPASGV